MEVLNKKLQEQFKIMCSTGKLYKSIKTGKEVWLKYLESFSDEMNPTYRDPNSSTHNCNNCNNFIKRYGNIVAIDVNFNLITLFDIMVNEEYQPSVNAMGDMLRKNPISNVFFETYDELNNLPYESCKKNNEVFRLGISKNHKTYNEIEANAFSGDVVKFGEVVTFNHFFLDLPSNFVLTTTESIESISAKYRTDKEVFLRAMMEIPLDTLNLVIDLINQGSLLNGATYLSKVISFKFLKESFNNLEIKKQDNWAWLVSHKLIIAKFKNELIGTLCTELAEGKEINDVCISWNKRVDPANFMKAVAPITEAQKKKDIKIITDLGYEDSLDRRFAILDDIKVNEIMHSNVGDGKIKTVSKFDNIKTTSSRHKKNEFKNIEEVSIDKFMKDILPTCSSVEAYLENKHDGNLVTMTTSINKDCKLMFKWDNPYSWTYSGNLAGKSMIKAAVKAKGGIVDGVLNFRLAWNDGKGTDNSDLDAWASEPSTRKVPTKIGFSTDYRKDKSPGRSPQSGQLDIDNTSPNGKLAVENITWNKLSKMRDGVYKLWVNQYSANNSQGFKAEIEFDGEIHEYNYDKRVSGNVEVAEVTLNNGQFTIKHLLPSTNSNKEMYGLETNKFHKVNLMCLSPNHWGDNESGNKHYFFMLDKCKTDKPLRSFHSENLNSELVETRKTLERFGAVNLLTPTNNQLSGIGFNATVKDDLILKLKGNFKRVIKLKF